jgi:hypothetical protein
VTTNLIRHHDSKLKFKFLHLLSTGATERAPVAA